MLVLSRRLNEKILFPTISAAVRVLGIKGNSVRLGIEAPADVTVLREEVSDRTAEWGPTAVGPRPGATAAARRRLPAASRVQQLVHSRLRLGTLGLALLRRQLQQGQLPEAQATLDKIEEDLHLLQQRLGNELDSLAPRPRELVCTGSEGRRAAQ